MWIIGAENTLDQPLFFFRFSEGRARARESVARGHVARLARFARRTKKKERLLVVKAENYATYQDLS